ncbi:MAG: pitrilysin family protein [Verrucomicrobiota bacterium]
MHHHAQLPNGCRVVTAEMPHMASAAIGLWVGVGGRHEPAALGGISHFIEHMVFKGTRRRTAAAISQAVEGIGGYLNAFTDEEHTCFYARAAAVHWPRLLDVLVDMLLHPRLDPADIDREREVILEEWSMYRDQPSELVHDLLNAAQFPRHPLGRPVIGTPATLRRIQRPDFESYMRSHYTAGALVIAAAGNVRHDDVVQATSRLARRFRPGPRMGFHPFTRPAWGPRVRVLTRPTEQANIGLGLRAASRNDPRRHALRLLNAILAENMSSRLFQVVREQHGLTYNIHSALTCWADVGDIVISAGLDTRDLEKTLRLVVRELDRLMQRPPGKAELQRARDYVLGQFDLSLESTENHMMWLGEQWLGHDSLTPPGRIRDHIAAVTASQVRAAAVDFLGPRNRTLALVSTRSSDRGLGRILAG